jgi:hypothetical protein
MLLKYIYLIDENVTIEIISYHAIDEVICVSDRFQLVGFGRQYALALPSPARVLWADSSRVVRYQVQTI